VGCRIGGGIESISVSRNEYTTLFSSTSLVPGKHQTGRRSCIRSLPGVSPTVRSLPRLWLGEDAGPWMSWPALGGYHDGGARLVQFICYIEANVGSIVTSSVCQSYLTNEMSMSYCQASSCNSRLFSFYASIHPSFNTSLHITPSPFPSSKSSLCFLSVTAIVRYGNGQLSKTTIDAIELTRRRRIC
jgi:hypothetical protein